MKTAAIESLNRAIVKPRIFVRTYNIERVTYVSFYIVDSESRPFEITGPLSELILWKTHTLGFVCASRGLEEKLYKIVTRRLGKILGNPEQKFTVEPI